MKGRIVQRRFQDRTEAGKKLADGLRQYAHRDDVIVLALPRGGVPVAYEVAHALNVPLDVLLVQKLGVPGREELAMGAVASGGARYVNDALVASLGITPKTVENVTQKEQRTLRQREERYQEARPNVDIEGQTAILIDDGLATGATMRAAIRALHQYNPQQIVVAVPTAPPDVIHDLEAEVDALVCLMTPDRFGGVGRWYTEFAQTSNQEVIAYLEDQPDH